MNGLEYRFLYPAHEGHRWLWSSPPRFVPVVEETVPVIVSPPIVSSTRPKRIIGIDLDETCIKSYEGRGRPQTIPADNASRVYELNLGDAVVWGMRRPFLNDFLRAAQDQFDYVVIYTASETPYAKAATEMIFEGLNQPHRIYARPECHTDGKGWFKPLQRVCDDFGVGLESLLMIDNNHFVIEPRFRTNLVHIPDYLPNPMRDERDVCLAELSRWLGELPAECDFRSIDKSKIFSTEPIMYRM